MPKRSIKILNQSGYLRQFIDSVPISIALGLANGTFFYRNDHFRSKLKGIKQVTDITTEAKFNNIVSALEEIDSLNFETNLTSYPDLWVNVSIVIDKTFLGDRDLYIFIVTDITSTRIRDRQLEIAQAKIDRLLYSASHDLKSPISSIYGLLHLIDLEPSTSSFNELYRQKLLSCVNKLNNIVDGLSNYALNTHARLKSEKVDVNNIIVETYEELISHISDGLKIDFSLRNDLNYLPIYSDENRIQVIVKNILSNAINFLDPKKEKHEIHVTIKYEDHVMLIEASDNGTGIPKAHLNHVFDMFYKANTHVEGAGLGLYTTRETVHTLGGQIEIDSIYGIGTTVSISIPNDPKGILQLKKLNINSSRIHG